MKRNVYMIAVCVIMLLFSGGYLYAGDTTGVSEKKIKIGSNIDLTGPSSFLGRGANVAAESYFRYINDRGGINGRKIKYVIEDNQYKPVAAVAALKKLIFRDKVFGLCFSWGTVTTLAIANDVQREKIPALYIGGSESIFNPFRRYIFSYNTGASKMGSTVADYIVNDMKPKVMRFACIYQDDEMGRRGLQGFKQAAIKHGAKWVGEEKYKRGALDFSSQVIKLKKAGANYIFLASVTREAAGILREAQKLDWHPQFFGISASIDKKVIELAGAATKGYKGCTFIVGWDEDIPGMVKARKTIMKYHGTLKGMSEYTNNGWVGAMLFSEGIKRAGRSLTREGLVKALESMKDFDPDGLMPPVTWGPNRREGQIGARILKVDFEKKVPVPVTGWRIPEY